MSRSVAAGSRVLTVTHVSSRGRYRPKTLPASTCVRQRLECGLACLDACHRLADDLEERAQVLDQGGQRERRDAAHETVRGEHGEPGVAQAAEVHHHRVGAIVARRPPLVTVGERGLVAVMAVGDVHRAATERFGYRLGGRAGERRCLVPVAVAVVGFAPRGRGKSRGGRVELRAHGAVVVREEQEDLADVGVGRPVQAQPVDFGAGVGALVRQDHSLLEVGEAQPRDEAAARALQAVRPRVRLVHDHDAGHVVAHQHSLVAPLAEGRGGAEVGLLVGRRAGRHGEVDVHGVVRAARSEVRGLRRREHVVGRRDHVVERDVVAIADASEGGDVGHRSPVCGGRGDERRPRVHACGKYSGVSRGHRLPDRPASSAGAESAGSTGG